MLAVFVSPYLSRFLCHPHLIAERRGIGGYVEESNNTKAFPDGDPRGRLRVDFAGTRADGTAVRSHPHRRKETNIVEGNLSDWPFILQPARLKGVATG